jgi:hypothetical protein
MGQWDGSSVQEIYIFSLILGHWNLPLVLLFHIKITQTDILNPTVREFHPLVS